MYAGVGDKPNALREAKRAVELGGDDTYYAPAAEEGLTIVEAQTGETGSALARLPQLLKAHYFSWGSFAPLTPSLLRLDPVWDPLRDDPQFQKLIKARSQDFFARSKKRWTEDQALSEMTCDRIPELAEIRARLFG